MDIAICLGTLAKDKSTDLYKALCWIENSMKRGESKWTLPAWEFKDLSILHNQLVWLGYSVMVYTEVDTGVRKIVVWW